jgi:hypothetical protein
MAVLCKGVPSIVVFEILLSHMKTFHYALRRTQPPPGPLARLCDVSALALGKTRFIAVTAYRCRVRFQRPNKYIYLLALTCIITVINLIGKSKYQLSHF